MTTGYYTTTRSETFTVTHAWHIAVKIGTDLKRMQRFYGEPDDQLIDDYEREAVALLHGDYLDWVTYGFCKDERWVVALKYAARYGGVLISDDNPGRVPRGVDVSGCAFSSVLLGTSKWAQLNEIQKQRFYADAGVSFTREPGSDFQGDWQRDRAYSAGGRGVLRHTVGLRENGNSFAG